MYLRFGYSQDKIIKKVEGYSHVSFDIYDTIIKRDICRNTQIFELMENELLDSIRAGKRKNPRYIPLGDD